MSDLMTDTSSEQNTGADSVLRWMGVGGLVLVALILTGGGLMFAGVALGFILLLIALGLLVTSLIGVLLALALGKF